MLLMWTPGMGELIVLVLVGSILYSVIKMFVRPANSPQSARENAILQDLVRRVSDLERRLDERGQ